MGLSAELRLVNKLKSLGAKVDHVFGGITTRDERMAKVRSCIITNEFQDVLFTVTSGRIITISDQFAYAYHEDLE